MTNDCVVSYHMNPLTCGVAKFNFQLAARLGVPRYKLWSKDHRQARYPLVSIKTSEIDPWLGCCAPLIPGQPLDLFLHDDHMQPGIVKRAVRVFAANQAIAYAIRQYRADVITAWCPSTLNGNPHRGAFRVLTFGMAHKLALEKFRELKVKLDAEHHDYTVAMSTAVHEGSPWDAALTESIEAMRAIFGDRLRVLGYLADDALARELQESDAVAVYFDPAVRENNTTLWAALGAGKVIYTNTDAHSPEFDLARYGWEQLVERVR